MLIEIHMIQNHSPANLNRDDLGAPKTCIFGGVTRARISSQCLKRSIRNPGNTEDIHNRGASLFAQVMGNHLGLRSKLFPWLVEQELKESNVPPEDHPRIVMAAQRIATAKEKDAKKGKNDADTRPKTPQLISFGRGDAKRFVAALIGIRANSQASEHYNYFLNPRVGFEEMVSDELEKLGISKEENDKDHKKLLKNAWVIAKCRMNQLPNNPDVEDGETNEPISSTENEQPGAAEAERVAKALVRLHNSENKDDKDRLKKLLNGATSEEKEKVKDDAPKKPKGYDKDFTSKLKDALTCNAVDVALFGRMTTSDFFEDVEASLQFAHAISTHAIVNEVDYFTAVDDLGKTGGGAGHVDEAQFNSACFYKYASLDWEQLVRNLAGKAPDKEDEKKVWQDEIKPHAEKLAAFAVGHFIRTLALTSPSGKQNSFAAHNNPCCILVEIKEDKIPTNYSNAFAEPVERVGKHDTDGPDEVSLEGRSVACLANHVHAMRTAYGIKSKLLWFSPMLWRFPARYWEREPDGRKTNAKDLADEMFSTLGGTNSDTGLVEAVIKGLNLGFEWKDIQDVAAPAEAR